MSYIFDALQRAQNERSGTENAGSVSTLELLECAEREAFAQTPEREPELPRSIFNIEAIIADTATTDPLEIAKALQEEKHRETFSHFQSLTSPQEMNTRLTCLAEPESPATEAFHLLGIRLRHLQKERKLQRLLVTSTVPQEGKSVVAANLACTLGSGAYQKVLLIDGDVRRPTQSQIFGIEPVPGLCDYLHGKRNLSACLYRLPQSGIWILPAGENPGNSSELIQSPELPGLLEILADYFDWIVIDSPPVLPMIDTSVWSRLSDGILLVARNGTTRKRKLQKGLEALDSEKLLGALLNASASALDNDYYYYSHTSESSDMSKESGTIHPGKE